MSVSFDAALDLMAALLLDDGRRWGEAAVAWQWEDARAVLDPASSTPLHFLTRARGGSKTSDLGGLAVAAMLAQLPPRSRLYALASDRDQARLLLDSIDGYASRTPALRGALTIGAYRVTANRGGSTLEILAADAPGAWGLRPSFLVVDEIAQWGTTGAPRRIWEAASTAAAKVAGARLVVLTTAGDPAHWSRKVLEHALHDPLWRVHEVGGPPPWIAPERLAEQRRRLLESSYRRLFENEWVAAEDRLARAEDLAACVTLEGPLAPERGKRYVVGVDLGLKRDATVAVVAHGEPLIREEPGGSERTVGVRVVLDRIETWQGSRAVPVRIAEVEDWIEEASSTFNHAPVVFDPWQAIGSAQRLRARGLRVTEFNFSPSSVGRLATTLHLLLRDRALALPDDPELLDELANVRLRESSPGVVRLDHDPDRHDDRAVALALAAHHLLARPVAGDLNSASVGDEHPGRDLREVFVGGGLDPSLRGDGKTRF